MMNEMLAYNTDIDNPEYIDKQVVEEARNLYDDHQCVVQDLIRVFREFALKNEFFHSVLYFFETEVTRKVNELFILSHEFKQFENFPTASDLFD